METAAIIVAAGRGTRAGGDRPKQWQLLAGRPVAAWTLDAFRRAPGIGRIVMVIHPDDRDVAEPIAGDDVQIVSGGATRDASVRAGLEALAAGHCPDRVLVHDVARPLVSRALIQRVCAVLARGAPAAAPGLAVSDALWRGENGHVSGVADRSGLYRAQTPQGFDFAAILAAHRAHLGGAADDVEVARAAGMPVEIVEGEHANLKITTADDFNRAAQLMGLPMEIRVGNGYDVHRFGDGDSVTLCGVTLAHGRGLAGHSDADVGMHALTDAIYGALADGDIGRHFPPSDAQWKDADSRIFLEHAVSRARERGYRLTNADVTLVCEAPKIGPHARDMAEALARIMGVEARCVSVKATTSERLGFTGREEGIAAIATATLVSP